MIVYRDLLSGDEMLSDAFKLFPVTTKDADGNDVEVKNNYYENFIRKVALIFYIVSSLTDRGSHDG